jgi:hypothetical protein
MARPRAAALAVILFADYFFYARCDLALVVLIPVLRHQLRARPPDQTLTKR